MILWGEIRFRSLLGLKGLIRYKSVSGSNIKVTGGHCHKFWKGPVRFIRSNLILWVSSIYTTGTFTWWVAVVQNVGRFAPLPVRPKSFRPLEIRPSHFDPNWVKSLEYERKNSERQSYHKLVLVLNLLQYFTNRANMFTYKFILSLARLHGRYLL